MSVEHGGSITPKPIGEIAGYLKNLLPTNIPETYSLKPMFEKVASEESIRKGVVAFRDFLYLFCDRLISDGHLYLTLPKKPKSMTDYPFLYNVTDLMADIGYNGKLSESGDSLLFTQISSPSALKCLRFLALCGFAFNGIDLEAKTLNISEEKPLEASYPDNPIMLTGLKAMSIADIELRTKRYKNDNKHDNLLRCDYRLLKAEETDALDVLKDILHSLPEEIQKFAIGLHRRYTDMGMTCGVNVTTFEIHFAYAYSKNSQRVLSYRDIYQKRIWEFAFSINYGWCLVIRAKNMGKYAEVIDKLPLSLREKIAKGFGCDRKLRNEPCQKGCQGFRIPLDNAIIDIQRDIELWLDAEVLI